MLWDDAGVETADVLSPGAADASVRPARAGDVAAVGAVHSRSWRAAYAATLPAEVLTALDPEALAAAWRPAVADPPTAEHRVLVACSGPTVVGFVATAPLPGPGTEREAGGGPGGRAGAAVDVVALHVDPAHQRRGHGSRLLAAAVDLARGDGATTVSAWCPSTDAARRAFLVSAGMGPDGAWRDLALPGDGSEAVREVRLVASLAEESPA